MLKAVALALASSLTVAQAAPSQTQTQTPAPTSSQAAGPRPEDPIQTLVGRLDLERYKATIKGLTQFGDRRQGTDRNRAAVDWIEAQLKSYGCPTERIKYQVRHASEGHDGRRAARRTGRRRRARRESGQQAPGAGREHDFRHPGTHRRQQRSEPAAR